VQKYFVAWPNIKMNCDWFWKNVFDSKLNTYKFKKIKSILNLNFLSFLLFMNAILSASVDILHTIFQLFLRSKEENFYSFEQ